MNRRSFLALGAKAAVGLYLAQAAPAWANIPSSQAAKPRTLSFYHTHTHERLDITYAKSGEYDIAALAQINSYLRDFRTSEVHTIDPAVLDILWTIQQKIIAWATVQHNRFIHLFQFTICANSCKLGRPIPAGVHPPGLVIMP
ncbi:MAG: DUF882 domain-containing protein [Candidatus Electrothrix sp. ATG2]|nr:DUF882 domain-containing protein [Candidatus Electrothrix sp. ATG2]